MSNIIMVYYNTNYAPIYVWIDFFVIYCGIFTQTNGYIGGGYTLYTMGYRNNPLACQKNCPTRSYSN